MLFLILFIGVVDNQVVLPILSLIAATFQRTASDLAPVITAYAFSAAILNLLFGPLSDRFGRKPILIFGLAGFTACGFGLSVVSAFVTFFLLRASMGVFAGILSTCVTAYVGDYFPYSVRGRAMGVVIASYFAALIFGVPMGAFIADHWHWHRIFLLISLAAALLTGATAWWLPALEAGPADGNDHSLLSERKISRRGSAGPASDPEAATAGEGYFMRYRRFLSSSEQLAALVSGAFVSGATLALLTFVSPWLTGRYGLTPTEVGLVFLIIGGASILAAPLSGWVSDLIGKRPLFLASSLAAAFFVGALPWIGSIRHLLALLFGTALMIAFRQTSQQALVTELTPRLGRGSFIALRNGFSQVGIGVSVLVASALFERYGFAGVALFSGFQSILAAAFFFHVREPAPPGNPLHDSKGR